MRVVVIFIFKDKKLLLIEHKRKKMWLPVGGHVKEGEELIEALKREIKEEIGLEVKISEKPFFILEEPNEITPHYIGDYYSGEIKINLDEILNYKWFSESEIKKSELNQEIKKLSIQAFKIHNTVTL